MKHRLLSLLLAAVLAAGCLFTGSVRASEMEEASREAAENEQGQQEAETLIAELTGEMLAAAEALEFERAAMLRDRIRDLRKDPAGTR